MRIEEDPLEQMMAVVGSYFRKLPSEIENLPLSEVSTAFERLVWYKKLQNEATENGT